MTATLRHFVQGIIDHGAACMALFNPTPQLLTARLTPHTFAPSNVSWGEEDRSAMVRIKQPGTPGMHVEMRASSAISNPYLCAAGTLACGLLGMSEKRSTSSRSRMDPARTTRACRLSPPTWRRRWPRSRQMRRWSTCWARSSWPSSPR